jgi:spore coat polysaccharide biosynthesis protein SpsF
MVTFIIQSRMGSTRLPGKLLLPFYGEKTILDILLDKLRRIERADVIIATTDNPTDDPIADKARQLGVKCYRGSENDVLARFIDAAKYYGAEKIVRVCSDNPFIDLNSMQRLVDVADTSNADYISFSVNGTPSILTHYGFWAEYVSLRALQAVRERTDNPFYHEHVTNYIYKHPSEFTIEWLHVEEEIVNHKDIRLTIDTEKDFRNAGKLFEILCREKKDLYPDAKEVVKYIEENPEFLLLMKEEIRKNEKR